MTFPFEAANGIAGSFVETISGDREGGISEPRSSPVTGLWPRCIGTGGGDAVHAANSTRPSASSAVDRRDITGAPLSPAHTRDDEPECERRRPTLTRSVPHVRVHASVRAALPSGPIGRECRSYEVGPSGAGRQ